MAWIVRLVSIGAEGEEHSTDVLRIAKPDDLTDLATLGLTLAEGKRLLAGLQQEIVAAQARLHAVRRPECRGCGDVCRVKDYRQHGIATLFGQVTVRLPRFCCAGCGTTEAGVEWPPHARSTPALDQLRAQLSALMTYRTAAALLGQMFPVDAGTDPETLRRHTFKVAEELSMQATAKPATPAKAIAVTLDSTFIRGCEDGERHLEVRIGNVETATGSRQVFAAVAKTDTDVGALIRRSLDAVGRTQDTALTAFTDGCPGLRRILLHAGVAGLPILDWFHLAMRLQHLTQIAAGLSSDDPDCAAAKAVIVEEVDRLHWRLWNGKAKDAQISLDRIHAVMHHFRGERDGRRSIAPSRKLWTALRALNDYLVGQSDWLVNYAERHRAGLRVGTALTEGTANFLVNRRMNKQQHMRWSRRGADRLLQVRCAVYNGTLGTGFGQRFQADNDRHPPAAIAA
ncbi:MAG TPA: ISKra4 family transposase [Acetobacteraceae bacterium]|nr:ISKra4 family transposase [Acetobacteraceae bacterium]